MPDTPPLLGPQWVDALVARAGTATPDAAGPDIVVQYEVPGGPVWHLGLRDGRVVAGAGPAVPAADVTIVHDAETAVALHAGRTNVQTAIAAGRIRVRGDVVRLRDARPVLDAIATATRTR